MALRDIIASVSVLVDDTPLVKLDRRLDTMKQRLSHMGMVAAGAGAAVGYGLFRMVESASSAEQTISGLGAVFKNNKQAAIDWARTTAGEMQRSTAVMTKAVFDFGKFLRPTFAGTNTDVLQMSESLTKLAVDLAAFNDTSFEEAQMRLFSGMTGETEAVRRLGINISDEALKALAQERGDNRAIAKMSLAEKTELRFIKIMRDSADAQGQAKRESQSWAGQLERLKGTLADTGVAIGQNFMAPAMTALAGLNELLDGVKGMIEGTSALQAALVVVGGYMAGDLLKTFGSFVKLTGTLTKATQAATVATVAQSAANVGLWASMAPLLSGALALGAAFAAIEDVFTFFRGGKSWTGAMLEAIVGVGDGLEWLKEKTELFWAILHGEGDKKRAEISTRRQQQKAAREKAVSEGDVTAFVANKGIGMGTEDAQRSFLQQRKALVSVYPWMATREDYDAGLLSDEAWRQAQASGKVYRMMNGIQLPTTDIVAGQAGAGEMGDTTASRAGVVGGPIDSFTDAYQVPQTMSAPVSSKTITNNVTNHITIDSEERMKEFEERMGLMFREGYSGDGEESN